MNVRKQMCLAFAVTGVCFLTACGAKPTTVVPTDVPVNGVENETPVPIATTTPEPTSTPTPTATPIPEPEEPGTAYTVMGPNGEIFKINVDDSGKMLTQRYYDAVGTLLGRNVVYYDIQGFLFGIECYNGNQELVGMVSVNYLENGSYEIYAKAESSSFVAATGIEITSDNSIEAKFVQADRRTMVAFMYLQDGTLQYSGIINYNEAGEEIYAAAYDTAGVLVTETTYERREDGSYKEEHNNYIASGNVVSHSIDEYDSHGNNTYSIIYDAEGAVSLEITTEWEYYANGNVKQYTKIREDNGNKTVEHEAYNEQGIRIEGSRLRYDTEGNCTGGYEDEYYDSGKSKQSTHYGRNGMESIIKYNEQGVQTERTVWVFGYDVETRTAKKERYEIMQYNDSGQEISRSKYSMDGSLQTKEIYEAVAEGTKTTIYNGAGLLTYIDIKNSEKNCVYSDCYTYDEEGHLTYRLEAIYAVNEGDKNISTQYYYTDGKLTSYRIEEIDAEGCIIRITEYDAEGNVITP